jgi:hypothetical protein
MGVEENVQPSIDGHSCFERQRRYFKIPTKNFKVLALLTSPKALASANALKDIKAVALKKIFS